MCMKEEEEESGWGRGGGTEKGRRSKMSLEWVDTHMSRGGDADKCVLTPQKQPSSHRPGTPRSTPDQDTLQAPTH